MSTDDQERVNLAAVTVRDKISLSVGLETRGVSSHWSRSQPPSAIDRLARVLARISHPRGTPQLTALTRRYFRALANASGGRQARDLRQLARARDSRTIERIGRRVIRRSDFGPLLTAVMRTAFTSTIIDAPQGLRPVPRSA
jgi:hypothetical protein